MRKFICRIRCRTGAFIADIRILTLAAGVENRYFLVFAVKKIHNSMNFVLA
jgi:hypothetical protein